jgi:Tetratricopeptide repeat
MRLFAIIFLLGGYSTFAQTPKVVDCRDIDGLMKPVWKHYTGTRQWMASMDSVIQLCPGNSRLLGDKAMAYMIRGEYVEGLSYLEKAVSIDPFYYLGNRAWYRMRYLHDYKGAIADLDRLEKVAGHTLVYVTNAHMYMLKGLAYKELGDHQKALELYNIAIDEQIKAKGADWIGVHDYLFRGILKFEMGNHEDAIADFDLQQKQYELLADTYYYRGMALALVGRKEEARVDLQRAKELILGDGQKRWEAFVILPNEIFLSQVETQLLRLY